MMVGLPSTDLLGLVGVIAKATVLLGLAYGIVILRRRAAATVRHLVWTGAIIGVLALIPLSIGLPWRWGVITAPSSASESSPPPVAPAELIDEADGVGPAIGPAVPPDRRDAPPAPSTLLVLVWIAGAGISLLGLGRGVAALRRIRREASAPADERVRRRAEALARRAEIDPAPILESDAVDMPMTAGVLRPVVIVPASMREWPAERQDAVLLHELAHIRRNDPAIHLLARICCAVYWFHPLVWIGARRLRAESEQACDDDVLRAGALPSDYAAHLLHVAGTASRRSSPAGAVAAAQPSEFEGRLLAILDPRRERRPANRRIVAATLAATALLTGTLGVMGVARAADEPTGDAAVEAVADSGSSLTDALLLLLEDPKTSVRASAAKALGDRRAERAVPALVRTLSDSSAAVRKRAAIALGKVESRAAVPGLADAALRDENIHVQKAVVWALGETEAESAVGALAVVAREADRARVRLRAIKALGETRRASAIPVLEEFLRSSDRDAQRRALAALAEIDTPAARDVLVRAMRSDEPTVRSMAADALTKHGR